MSGPVGVRWAGTGVYHRGAARYRAGVHVIQDGSAHRAQVLLTKVLLMSDAEAADWLIATEAEGA
ncbi:hypothetical protein [Streptomyces sp. NPDC058612]|uniref:hypothetical protein n=1 Tax=Streptomyces sp. NPDC058612 TaxID=3346555 RepID=UPI00366007F8